MRTLIDLTEEDIAALDSEAKAEGVSRAALMRQAIAEFLGRRKKSRKVDGFGLWKKYPDTPKDGLEYQKKIRGEWS